LSYFLLKKYDAAYTLASEALGLPLVGRLDDTCAQIMWSDANVNVMQQQIIKKHLQFHFGKRLFIPEEQISKDATVNINTIKRGIGIKKQRDAPIGVGMPL